MHGKIKAENRTPNGAKFTVSLRNMSRDWLLLCIHWFTPSQLSLNQVITSTQWRVVGHCFEVGYAPTVAFRRNACLPTRELTPPNIASFDNVPIAQFFRITLPWTVCIRTFRGYFEIAILQTATNCIFHTVATSATTKPQRHKNQFSLWLRALVWDHFCQEKTIICSRWQ